MMSDDFIIREQLPHINDFWDLYMTTDWNEEYHFTQDEVQRSLSNNWYALSIYHMDRLIGFGAILSDGLQHALIVNLIIHPQYQNKGHGSCLLGKLVQKCQEERIRDIQLFCIKDKSGFYTKFGFGNRPLDAPGMQYGF